MFVTSSDRKLKHLHTYLRINGIENRHAIDNIDLSVVEPQLDTVREVALAKAHSAWDTLGVPLIVEDSGFSLRVFGLVTVLHVVAF